MRFPGAELKLACICQMPSCQAGICGLLHTAPGSETQHLYVKMCLGPTATMGGPEGTNLVLVAWQGSHNVWLEHHMVLHAWTVCHSAKENQLP